MILFDIQNQLVYNTRHKTTYSTNTGLEKQEAAFSSPFFVSGREGASSWRK